MRASGTGEMFYVVAPQAFLRDRVAAIYQKTGTVRNGDQVEVLEPESLRESIVATARRIATAAS